MALLGETFPLLLNVGARRYDAVALQKMADEFEAYFARGERYAVVSVQPKDTQVPDASERKLISEWANSERVRTYAHKLCVGTATVIDSRGAEALFTDGPFVESKEYLAGFWIIEAADLDVALTLAADGSKACNRKTEVRPFL